MAIFRKVHTSFWSDSFTGELDTEKKLFYLYLITNEKTTACGIYEIRKRQISFDLGYSIDRVTKLLDYFIEAGKIMYNDETSEIALKNWYKYNPPSSPKIQSCINKEVALIKDTVLIQYVNGIYTQSPKDKDQDQDQDQYKYRKILLSQIAEADLEEPNKTYFKIAISFYELFRKIIIEAGGSSKTLEKANGKWIDDIRLMVESDKIEIDKIRQVWGWLPKSDFWKKNIQSTASLRKQFNKLIIESNHERTKSNNGGISEANQEILRRGAERIFATIDERDRKLSGQQI